VSKAAAGLTSPLPTLPMEIQLQILTLALTSPYPIIDPLSKLKPEATTQEEKERGNQIAIGFLAASKAHHVEGTRILWKNNTFTFSSHHALRNFGNLSLTFRDQIRHINFRIIAKYYDDERRIRSVNANDGTRIKLKCALRLQENTLSRKGYKSYTWYQLIDFLEALRPPYDPSHPKKQTRPRLLPGLKSLRIDLVNFPKDFLMFPDHDLHRLAAHDLGCTLEELIVTGLPQDERGRKAMMDLTGVVKDDGLVIKAHDTYIQSSGILKLQPDCMLQAKVVRAWKHLASEKLEQEGAALPSSNHHHNHHDATIPPVKAESGHPDSLWRHRRTVWKRIPLTRDSDQRTWAEFSRTWGNMLEDYVEEQDKDDSDDIICEECGEVHDPFSDHDF